MRRARWSVAACMATAACYGHDDWNSLSSQAPFIQQQTAVTPDQAQTSLSIELRSAPRLHDTLILHDVQIGQSDPISVDGGGATWTRVSMSCQHLCTNVWVGVVD